MRDTNSSNATSTLALTAIVATAVSIGVPAIYASHSSINNANYSFQKVSYQEDTSTPELTTYKNKNNNWVTEAQSLFPEVRYFTEEEANEYDSLLSDLFKPTGRNFFDIC